MSVLDIIIQNRKDFGDGLYVTFKLCLIIWLAGLFLGICVGAISARFPRLVGIPARLLSFVLSGVPIIVFLYWAHFPFQELLTQAEGTIVVIDPFLTASVVLTIVNTFCVADAVRSALIDFPQQYITAAKVCGLSATATVFRIQLPIMWRQLIPVLLPLQINMLQATLFASFISVGEIFRAAQRVNSDIHKPVEIYTALGVFLLAICLPVNALAIWLRTVHTRFIRGLICYGRNP